MAFANIPIQITNGGVGATSLVPYDSIRFYAIKCNKGRGIILPGGKVEPREGIKAAAARELKEEAGLTATRQELVFQGMNTDGFYVYVFNTRVLEAGQLGKDHGEGELVLATWRELLTSDFAPFYELLRDAYQG